jgi:DNA-dependent protein kinase catalytic subunit
VDKVKQEKVLTTLFKSFKASFEVVDKMGYIEQFMLPMLQSCDLQVLTSFFAANLPDIWAIIKEKFEAKQSSTALRRQIVAKSGCFKIVEVMYGRLSHVDFQKDMPIGNAFPEQDSLNKLMTKAAYSVRSEKLAVRIDEQKLYQEYQCSAFNTLVAIICCLYPQIQDTEELKYSEFLFASNQKSNWAQIVDCSSIFGLRIDFEKIPTKKSVLVNIRTDARTHRRAVGAARLGSYRSQTVQYIASQQLFDSSLSEDVTKFDLSNVSVMSFSPDSQGSAAADSQPDEVQQEVLLEMDSFNQHPCMPILCALVRKLGAKPKPPGKTLPKWMQNLLDTMRNASTHPNVKMFLTKLIINTEDVFKQYAEHWLEVLCAVVNSKSLGKTINYMITDTVSVILGWHDKAVPDIGHNMQKIEASTLLLTMMEMSCHRRRDVMKFALELIKTMVEVWKAALSVNYQFLYQVVCESKDSNSIVVGLQLTAILLVNKRVPWNATSQVDFLNSLIEKHLMSTDKKIRGVAAENLGK